MAFQYLDKKNLFDAYDDSTKYMRTFFDPLDEFERVARDKPHAGIAKEYPKVTDGSASSIINKTPRRVIQQLPTGSVISDTDDWLSIVASFIYLSRIIPNANMQYALLEKCWLAVKNTLTYGSCTAYTPFIRRGQYFGTDMTLPFIKDVLYQSGKLSSLDSNFKFLRAWYQPRDIDAEIYKQEWLKKQAAARGEKYESPWDLKELAKIRDKVAAKTDEQSSRSEKEKSSSTEGGIEIIHAFQDGIGAEFYSFHPATKKIVRVKANKDPRGLTPLDTMYADVDGYNPVGWGLIEQLAPLQNLLDSDMQMYQLERALMLAPPTIKRGNWSKSQAKLIPNVIVDLGTDPNNSWEVLDRNSNALQSYPEIYGLMKSQLLNRASSPDTSISADIGNPGFSKTDSGVKQLASNISVDDNYIRKQFETFYAAWSETAINLYFAERTGVETIQLDKATAAKLRKLQDFDQDLLNDKDQIQMNWDSATEALKFEVDASTSNMKDDQRQLEAMDGLLERYDKSPTLQAIVPQEKIVSVWNTIVSSSGVEDPEELSIDEEEVKARMEQQQAMQMAQMQVQSQQANAQQAQAQAAMMQSQQQMPPGQTDQGQQVMDMPEESIAENVYPTDEMLNEASGMPPVELSDNAAFIQALRDMGYEDDRIQQALAMEQEGMSNEEIMSILEGSM